MTALARACLGMLLLALLAGCSSPIVRGRVIEGPINVTTLVSSNDDRLNKDNPGLAGAEIEMLAMGMSSPNVFETDKDGRFEVKLPRSVDATGAISLRIEAPGHIREQTSVPFPPLDSEILIVLPKR